MSDADESQLTALLGPAHRVGEAQVGVTYHPEHGVDAVRDQGLHEHVGDGAAMRHRGGEADVDPVLAFVHVVGSHRVSEALGRLPGDGVVVVAMPGAPQQTVLDGPFADRSALVGAPVLERAEATPTPGERHGTPVQHAAVDPSVLGDVLGRDAMPAVLIHRSRS